MKQLVLALIRFYQKTALFQKGIFRSLFLTDASCRFTPSCSVYTYEAVERFGVTKGLSRGFMRVIRCHPWSHGGYDPVR